MRNLSEILTWKQNFGLLPIHLKPKSKESSFVMLNGGTGDFCLQTIKDKSDKDDYFSKSWSSNTKNFVVLNKDNVELYNWLKEKPEVIPQRQVAENFNKFYSYLLSNSYKSDNDVVPFIISIFRQFRNLTLEKTNPVEALNLLFVLLTSLEDENKKFDAKKWNINTPNIPNGFNYYTDTIRSGINNIKPEFDLIIRHSAGVLFQEAQKEVLFFDSQMDLFGGMSSKLETKNNLYSSIHYTPPYLARTIVENSIKLLDLNKSKLKIFDPACGSAEFLIEALKQLKELNYKGNLEVIGWDSSETAINTSNFLLKYEQRTIWEKKLQFSVTLVEDSLTEKWDNDYDLILMNPPFVSWELLNNKNSKDAVKEALKNVFNGKPNQASAFFYKAIQCLKPTGAIGCVIPSSLLTLDAYKELRDAANELITINLIGKLGNFVFEDALTDVSLIIGHTPKTSYIPTILWTRNEKGIAQTALRDFRKMLYSNKQTINEKDYSVFQPISFPIIKESWKPISLKENDLLKTIQRFVIEKKLVRTDDIFNVQQGIRQGVKNIFKISEIEFKKLPSNEKKYFRPVIDNESIKNGALFAKNYIWYPYKKDGIIFQTEKDVKTNANNFYVSKLKPNEALLKLRAGSKEWWGLTRPRTWQYVKKQKLVSSEFGKSDSFAFDKEGSFVVERGNAWIPIKEFSEKDYYFYLAIFSSTLFDKFLSIYSKQLAGGNWYDLGKMYTSQIPIPNVHSEEVKNSEGYNKLVAIGLELSNGQAFTKQITDELLYKYFYPVAQL
jgi:adenine-specific DNA-methyltransferase